MRSRGGTFSSLVLASSLLATGCGGSTGGAKSSADAGSGAGVGKASEPAAPRILEPASAPSGVLVRFRVRNMANIADSVMEAAMLPLDWRSLLEGGSSRAPYLKAIDWESSIEGVLTMNVGNPAQPHEAISVGVKGIEPVLRILDKEDIPSVEGPGGVHYFEASRQDCAVGPAIKGSAARVVCSERRASLDLLLPYALRGLPAERLSDADMHLEFEMAPLRKAYGKELKTYLRWAPAYARSQHVGHPTYDRALSDGATALAREGSFLIDELQRLTVQVSHDSGDFTGTVNLSFKGDQSDTVQLLKELAARQDGAPALFDTLPSTATSAGFDRGFSTERTARWMSIIADLIAGTAEQEGASREFAKRLVQVVKGVGPRGETGVFARGPLIEVSDGAEKALRPAWVLSGTSRKKAQVEKLFDNIGWLFASPDMKKLAPQAPGMPSLKRKTMSLAGAPGATVYEWSLPEEYLVLARILGAQMGPEVDSDELVGKMDKLSSGLIAVHQVGDNTWLSWGQKKEELAESFQALTNPDTQKLASLGDLGGVRSEPAASAGYAKLDGLAGMASWLFPASIVSDWGEIRRAMPGGGTTPVVYFFKVKDGPTTTASWEVRVPAAFTRDLAALSFMLAQEQGMSLKHQLSD